MPLLAKPREPNIQLHPSPWTPLRTRFHYWLAGLAVALFIADITLAHAVQLHGLTLFLGAWPSLLLIVACIAYCLVRRLQRLSEASVLAFWGIILSNLLSALILVAGRSSRGLLDRQFADLDAKLGFSTASLVHLAAHARWLEITLHFCYPLLGPLVVLALLVPPLLGRVGASRRFILGASVSALITAACFAMWPAAGPWTTEDLRPSSAQARISGYLEQLKSPGPAYVDLDEKAVVSFPSFHVALAIVTATCLASFRRASVPVWIITGLICISTLTTGWHYGIDVLGGVVSGIMSIIAASRLDIWLSSSQPAHCPGAGSKAE